MSPGHYVYYHYTKKKRSQTCTQKYINLENLESQISEFLSKIHVPERLLDLAIEHLKGEEKEENEKYLDVQKSLEKTYKDCQKKLDNLNQMRLKDLIDDEEYIRKKKRLLDEKIKLEESLKNGNSNGRRAIELTEKTLIFASQARARFQNGSLEDKRAILQGLGSNLTLLNKKLTILIEKPFLILEEGLKMVNVKKGWLEPSKTPKNEREIALSFSKIQSWCP